MEWSKTSNVLQGLKTSDSFEMWQTVLHDPNFFLFFFFPGWLKLFLSPEHSRGNSITAHCVPPWTLDDVLKELHGRHYIFILCGVQNRRQVRWGWSPAGRICLTVTLPFGRFLWILQPSPFRLCSGPSSKKENRGNYLKEERQLLAGPSRGDTWKNFSTCSKGESSRMLGKVYLPIIS